MATKKTAEEKVLESKPEHVASTLVEDLESQPHKNRRPMRQGVVHLNSAQKVVHR